MVKVCTGLFLWSDENGERREALKLKKGNPSVKQCGGGVIVWDSLAWVGVGKFMFSHQEFNCTYTEMIIVEIV